MKIVELARRYSVAILAVLLVGLVWAVFGQACWFEYLPSDDLVYTNCCPFVRDGLSWANTCETFRNVVWGGIWMPVTTLTHAATITFCGNGPGPQHAVSIAFHSVNAVLFFLLLLRLSRFDGEKASPPPFFIFHSSFFICFLAAALWALHPLRVESVAWIASRKDTLFTLFTLLGLLAWQARRWGWGCVLMALSCMSKPAAICFPFLALTVECLGEGRMRPRDALRYVPLLVMAAATGLLATYSQSHANGIETEVYFSTFGWRMLNAAVSTGMQLYHTVLPTGLHYWYRPIHDDLPLNTVLGCAVLAVATLGAAWAFVKCREHRRVLLLTGLWFATAIGPTLGIAASFGRQAYADRFTYVPMMAFSILLVRLLPNARRGVVFVLAMLSLAYAAGTFQYTRTFRNGMTTTVQILECDPGNAHSWRDYGGAILLETHNPDAAIPYFQKAWEMDQNTGAIGDLVFALFMRNKPGDAEAIERLTAHIQADPSKDQGGIILDVLAKLAMRRKDYDGAIRYLTAITQLEFPMAERAAQEIEQIKAMQSAVGPRRVE